MLSGVAKLLFRTTNPLLKQFYKKLLKYGSTDRGKYELARMKQANLEEIIPMVSSKETLTHHGIKSIDEVIGLNAIEKKYLTPEYMKGLPRRKEFWMGDGKYEQPGEVIDFLKWKKKKRFNRGGIVSLMI